MTVSSATAKESIINVINFELKGVEQILDGFEKEKENYGLLYVTQWRLASAIKAEVKNQLLTKVKNTLEEGDVDLKEYITYIKESELLYYLTNGRFNQNSTSPESNLIALYTGEVYGDLYGTFETFVRWIEKEQES